MTVGIHAPSRSGPDAPHERSSPPVSQPTPAERPVRPQEGPQGDKASHAAREEEHRERQNGTNQAGDEDTPMRETSKPNTGIDHPWLDARSLDMARIVVARIDADPSVIQVAQDNLARWSKLHGGLNRPLLEWVEILKRLLVGDPRDPPCRDRRGPAPEKHCPFRRHRDRG